MSTERTIEFTERVIEAAAAAQGRRPLIELHLQPAEGHTTPAGAYAAAAAWLVSHWR